METTDRQNQDDKQKALDMTVQYVEKRFGKGSLMRWVRLEAGCRWKLYPLAL